MSEPQAEEPRLTFNVGDPVGDAGEYRIQDKNPKVTEGVADPLGGGGAGQVYRAEFKESLTRAIKFLQPRKLGSGGKEAFERTFAREQALLARLNHSNLAKLVDFGTLTCGEQEIPYLVTDFIDGVPIDEVWTQDLDGVEFLSVIDGVLAAVEYLHDRGILHADLKSENILCAPDSDHFIPFVLDVGVAKFIPGTGATDELAATAGSDDVTRFWSTDRICPPKWVGRLGKTVTSGELLEMFPAYDLYTIGFLLKEALEKPQFVARLVRDLHPQAVEGVALLRDRLLASPSEPYYFDVTAVREDWAKLGPLYLAPVGVPELALSAQFHHSLATWRGRIVITDRLHEVVNHDVFQRLRDIPQLELVSRLYPGATHTRMQHALSTFETARQYVAQLLNDHRFRLSVEQSDVEAILLQAMLHDIGHFPLSHMFEDFASEPAVDGLVIPTDDDLFGVFLDPVAATEPYPRLRGVLAARGPSLAAVIQERFDDQTLPALHSISAVLRASEASPNSIHCVLAGLVSSAIDADKVAYLADDSRTTGVAYGAGVDLEGLLGALVMPPVEAISRYPVIAVLDKGLSAAESVALARYGMLRRVYWHHTNRSIMAMTKFAIARLLAAGRFDMDTYLESVAFDGVARGLDLLRAAVVEAARDSAFGDGPTLNTLDGLVAGRRVIHRRVLEVPYGPDQGNKDLYVRLSQLRWKELQAIEDGLTDWARSKVGSTVRGDLLIDVPVKRREGIAGTDGGTTWVYPPLGGDRAVPLADASPIIRSLGDEFDYHVKKCRVFASPRLVEALDFNSPEELAKTIRDVLTGVLS